MSARPLHAAGDHLREPGQPDQVGVPADHPQAIKTGDARPARSTLYLPARVPGLGQESRLPSAHTHLLRSISPTSAGRAFRSRRRLPEAHGLTQFIAGLPGSAPLVRSAITPRPLADDVGEDADIGQHDQQDQICSPCPGRICHGGGTGRSSGIDEQPEPQDEHEYGEGIDGDRSWRM